MSCLLELSSSCSIELCTAQGPPQPRRNDEVDENGHGDLGVYRCEPRGEGLRVDVLAALGGAGLLFTEMTCPTPDARITTACTGLWSDKQEADWTRLVDFIHETTPSKMALQLGHAGRAHLPRQPVMVLQPTTLHGLSEAGEEWDRHGLEVARADET